MFSPQTVTRIMAPSLHRARFSRRAQMSLEELCGFRRGRPSSVGPEEMGPEEIALPEEVRLVDLRDGPRILADQVGEAPEAQRPAPRDEDLEDLPVHPREPGRIDPLGLQSIPPRPAAPGAGPLPSP